MPNDEQPKRFLPVDVCPALRTKSMRLNQVYATTKFEERNAANVAIFTCLQTMTVWGPDGNDVSPDGCRPGRSCWCGNPT